MSEEETLHPSVNEESYSVYSWFLVSLVFRGTFKTFCKVMGAAQTGLFSFGSSRLPGAVETGGRSREGNRLGSAVSFSEVPPMSLAQSSEAQSRLVANEDDQPK